MTVVARPGQRCRCRRDRCLHRPHLPRVGSDPIAPSPAVTAQRKALACPHLHHHVSPAAPHVQPRLHGVPARLRLCREVRVRRCPDRNALRARVSPLPSRPPRGVQARWVSEPLCASCLLCRSRPDVLRANSPHTHRRHTPRCPRRPWQSHAVPCSSWALGYTPCSWASRSLPRGHSLQSRHQSPAGAGMLLGQSRGLPASCLPLGGPQPQPSPRTAAPLCVPYGDCPQVTAGCPGLVSTGIPF